MSRRVARAMSGVCAPGARGGRVGGGGYAGGEGEGGGDGGSGGGEGWTGRRLQVVWARGAASRRR